MRSLRLLLFAAFYWFGACTLSTMTQTPPALTVMPDTPVPTRTTSLLATMPAPGAAALLTRTPRANPAEAVLATEAALATETVSALEAGQWTYLFYHESMQRTVMVNGGPERGKPADDPLELWSWDGTRWLPNHTGESGPTWRNWAAVAYDSLRDVLVVHGGEQSRRSFDETWEWDGQTWTRFNAAGPGRRAGALMVYDSARARTVLFGGATQEIHADTWLWDG